MFRDSLRLAVVRSDPTGSFEATAVAPATLRVTFRKPGYGPLVYVWTAVVDSTATVHPILLPFTGALDTVRVLGESTDASVLGLVIDDFGQPIPEALVEVLGTGTGGATRRDGGFLFTRLRPSTYVLRVRKIGFEPASATAAFESGANRELILRMRRLPVTLSAAEVRERSGYGVVDAVRWRDLDERLRWRGIRSYVLDDTQLARYRGHTLDVVVAQIGARWDEYILTRGRSAVPRRINPAGGGGAVGRASLGADGDACILLDGKTFVRRPLSTFRAEDIELLEVYPMKSEVTGTIASRMHFECEEPYPIVGPRPNWYVIWLKGSR